MRSAPDENKSGLLGKNPVKQKNNHFDFVSMFNVHFSENWRGLLSLYLLFVSWWEHSHLFFKFVFYCWNLCLSNLGIGFDYFDCSTTRISHKAAASPDSGYIGSGGKKTWNRHNSNLISSKIKIIQDILDRRWRKHGIDTIQNIFYQKKK